ncbi:MAG: Ni/Fe hydrogenase subunit gamma [Alcanivorax sp.]|jgi:DNA-binding transcriptional LysR family regulator|uniref:LysR family transcriptional regulator n=1 Tax=Alloalcanivorax venustensis ISO4 TaxID=1177184 RepID=A0ABS0ABE7_9GAMM|nr:LysR substrate-binding domain-containing protein [Alloalcanivorax venustensis]MBF5051455.1 LysR family transcriptional regulator [Alloalcanivorax venustensis ISO4]MBG14266.1 Ni/Fe hydrogenase subunit gamma [Alcanivorax sp.]
MNDTTLRQWRLFLAVAETGSVAAAAEAVALTQPAVSQALAGLEARLDTALFDRVGRGLRINAAGRQLLPEARALLAQATRCETLFQAPVLEVSLAATHTLGSYYLPARLAAFRQRHPDARVDMQVVNTDAAVRLLLDMAVDLAFVEGPVSHRLLSVHRWHDDVLLRVVAADRQAALGDDPSRWAWVMREPGSGTRNVIEQRLADAFPPAQRVLQLGSGEAVRQAILAGAGVGYVSEVAAAAALRDGRLKTVPGAQSRLVRPLYRLHHRQRGSGAGERALLASMAGPAD